MTGEKDRYKTHEQLWKLEDGDLSTPQHDELVLQLLNKNNIVKLIDVINMGYYDIVYSLPSKDSIIKPEMSTIKRKLGEYEKIKKDQIDMLMQKLDPIIEGHLKKNLEYIKNEIENIDDTPSIFGLKSEVPIRSGNNNFIIGYIDIQFSVDLYEKEYHSGIDTQYETEFIKTNYEFDYSIQQEKEISSEMCSFQGNLIGISTLYKYIPAYTKYHDKEAWRNKEDSLKINIEAKPKIKSFGETLRQINTYREFDPRSIYVIYSPDTRFKAAFETQGIKFITPMDIGINMGM